MRLILGGTLLWLAFVLGARAQALPNYDPNKHCQIVASFGGGFSQTTMNACLQMEQEAYNRVKPDWGSLDDAIRAHCDNVASFGGEGSYSTLDACISMEQSAGQANQQFHFQR